MYMDTVVLAGIGTVLLMFGFFGGVGAFIVHDMRRRKTREDVKKDTFPGRPA